MHSSIVKIAVSLKQLEANVARARAQGIIRDTKGGAGAHFEDAQNFIKGLSDTELGHVRARYPALLTQTGINTGKMAFTSHAQPSLKRLTKSPSIERRQKVHDMIKNMSEKVEPASNPLDLVKNTVKDQVVGKIAKVFLNLKGGAPSSSSDPGSRSWKAVTSPNLLSHTRLAVDKQALAKADRNAEEIKKRILNERGKVYLKDNDLDIPELGEFADDKKKLNDPSFRSAVKTLIANHELNELNEKKFAPGSRFITSKPLHSHAGMQGLHDVTMVNTMGKDSPEAQAFTRNLRKDEINDMLRTAPELNPVLKNMAGGESGRYHRILSSKLKALQDNEAHNKKILSKVPARLHNHPMVQSRLKPLDPDLVDTLVTAEHDKSGRLNRHMLKHVGNVLDKKLITEIQNDIKKNPKPILSSEQRKRLSDEGILRRALTNKLDD